MKKTKARYVTPRTEYLAMDCNEALANVSNIKVDPDTGDDLTPGGEGDAGDEGLAKPGDLWDDDGDGKTDLWAEE